MQGITRLILAASLGGLTATAAVAAPTAQATPAATDTALDDTKLICRKTLETGSLVRKTKQCFTALQWDRIAQQTRIGNQKVADQLTTACGVEGGC